MSEDADDDIVDLLEVVQVGKAHVTGARPLEPDLEDELDALLLENAQAAGVSPAIDTPFPDPTPVAHKVDPDEELDMPSMDDLDSLLASLGVPPVPGFVPDEDGNLPPGCDDMPDPDARPMVMPPSQPLSSSLDVDSFASAMAQATRAPAAPLDDPFEAAVAKAAPEPALAVPLDDPFEAAVAKATPEPAPAVPLDDPFEAAVAKAAPEPAPAAPLDDPFEAAVAKAAPEPAVPLDDPFEAAVAKAAPEPAPAAPLDDPFEAAVAKAAPEPAPAVPLDDPFEAAVAKAAPEPAMPLDDPFEAAVAREAADEAVADAVAAVTRAEDALLATPAVEENALPEEAVKEAAAAPVEALAPDAPPPAEAGAVQAAEESGEGETVEPGEGEAAAGAVGEDIDLHELDALLDDMLAAAPASGITILSSSESRGPLAPPAEHAVPSVAEGGVVARVEAVEGALESLRAEVSLSVRTELGALHAALRTLGQELHAATELAREVKSLGTYAEGADVASLPQAADPGSSAESEQAARIAALQTELDEYKDLAQRQQEAMQELQSDFATLHADLDKLAAEAAARVIREELRELLQSME